MGIVEGYIGAMGNLRFFQGAHEATVYGHAPKAVNP